MMLQETQQAVQSGRLKSTISSQKDLVSEEGEQKGGCSGEGAVGRVQWGGCRGEGAEGRVQWGGCSGTLLIA